MAIAAILLTDLAIRATDLNVMYTDEGMFPRAEIRRLFASIWNWSFHLAGGTWEYQTILMGVAAVLALALMAGFKTRVAVIGSWLMLVSIHHRVPPIISGAEILLRMLLFWAMFLPLGRRWSLDAWLQRRRGIAPAHHAAEPVTSVASAAILLQMGLMYVFSAIFKSNPQWTNGEALAGIFAHDFYGSPAGAYLLQFPRWLRVLTQGTLLLEWVAPLLLFLSGRTRLRLAAIGALALLHAGIGICMEVGLFPWVALAGLTLFLPAPFWNHPFSPERLTGTANAAGAIRRSLGDPAQRLCLIFLLYVVAVNLNSFRNRPLAPLSPEKWTPLARGLGLSQYWGVFEAIPSKDGWYVAWAKLQDGSEVDLLRKGAPVDAKRPAFPPASTPIITGKSCFARWPIAMRRDFSSFASPWANSSGATGTPGIFRRDTSSSSN
jgi:hypothetical protein